MSNNNCDTPGLLDYHGAMALLTSGIAPLNETEIVALPEALNRINSLDIVSPNNIPNYDNSAMDGYVLDCDSYDVTQPLTVIGESLAGHPFKGRLTGNQCVRIMTGAKIPPGGNCVVIQENTERQGTTVTLKCSVNAGDNIRQAGNDVAAGSVVLAAGRRIGPIEIGMLASVGIADVSVYRQPRIAVFSTGDELQPLGHRLLEGQLHDSNRYLLIAALQQLNFCVQDLGCIPDDPRAIEQAFITAARDCDAIVTSGGVSVGDADYTRDVLLKLGEVNFYKLAIKPGKPFAFGRLRSEICDPPATHTCYFFGLPGNPVSTAVTFHQLALPAIKLLSGEANSERPKLQVKALSNFKKRPGRMDFQRAKLGVNQNGDVGVMSVGNQSSGALSSMLLADCYVQLETDRGTVSEGETVAIIAINQLR